MEEFITFDEAIEYLELKEAIYRRVLNLTNYSDTKLHEKASKLSTAINWVKRQIHKNENPQFEYRETHYYLDLNFELIKKANYTNWHYLTGNGDKNSTVTKNGEQW